jgi:outer membrane immunogenic protein
LPPGDSEFASDALNCRADFEIGNWGRDMKNLLIVSAAALSLSVGSALAADMPPAPAYKAPPPPPPAVNWTGCYLNAGAGYGFWNQDAYTYVTATGAPSTVTTTLGGRGWLGDVGGGCDYQFSLAGLGEFVIGALGDYSFSNVNGQYMEPLESYIGQETESGSWSVGGRIGYLVTPNLLAYWDGGYTEARFDQVSFGGQTGGPALFAGVPSNIDVPGHTYSGFFIGGGTEYALNFSWLPIRGLYWRNEYRFSDYQSANLPLMLNGGPYINCAPASAGGFGLAACSDHVHPYTQTITSSLVWKFN